MIREQIADMIAGGRISEMHDTIASAQAAILDQQNTIHKLELTVEGLKDGSIQESAASDLSWQSRLLQDQQWVLASGSQQHRYIQKSTVDLYADMANFMYIFSPLIRRAVTIKTLFTFSRSYSISSKTGTVQAAIDKVKKAPLNKQAFFSQQATREIDAELQKTGNVYIAIWRKLTPAQIRVWTSYEIGDIILDENDSNRPMYYIRSWVDANGKNHEKAYPSVFNDKIVGIIRTGQGTYTVDNDVVVYHLATDKGLRQKWALTELTAAMRWAKAHEGFLEDFGAIVRAIRKYTSMVITSGGNAQVSALQSQFSGSTSNAGTPLQSNPAGSMLVASAGTDYKVVDAGKNKIVGLDESRYFLIMVCAGSGVPETLLTGDPSTGNLATAKELTGPFLTLIESRQEDWTDMIAIVFSKILGTDNFEVSFPPIRSQDALDYINSLIAAATLNSPGVPAGTISPEDLIGALYEALDIKLTPETKEALVGGFMSYVDEEEPDLTAAITRMATAAKELAESSRLT